MIQSRFWNAVIVFLLTLVFGGATYLNTTTGSIFGFDPNTPSGAAIAAPITAAGLMLGGLCLVWAIWGAPEARISDVLNEEDSGDATTDHNR